jgi:hypothetical protein
MARYLPAALPTPPPLPIDASEGVATWPMYLNDRLGDCACAAPGHMEEVFSKAVGTPRMLEDSDILALYELQGYNPADPATDQGSDMGHVLQDWRNNWTASKIYAYCEVAVDNEAHLQLALWLFRGLYIGIALPLTAQSQPDVWDVVKDDPTRNGPGTWGGHAVNVVAINADGSRDLITWGKRIKMTKAFWDTYVDECYAVVTHDLASDAVLADNGFDLQQLEADMAELNG